ncbi:hypothetical protein HLB23_16755 [Nocardia uniformis]|uniref:Uridine kinase n=1 Tax=Nocardia uniformis TaxID=53432 RepID=A0A849BYY0_9NOCA|nr:hypothetical protein [Nocardia uniformis]NNH71494.1 hypothetical protein [Nocardia uniformis]
MPEFTAVTPDALLDLVATRARTLPEPAVIAIDGADAAAPVPFARAIADRLRAAGRPGAVISLHDYVRPASLRFEYDRADEFTYRTAWFDYAALKREVLTPLRLHSRWLPALWDERTDRSARARIRTAALNTVLLIAGPMLIGRDLDFDLTVGLRMSDGALRRRTDPDDHFTIEALREHQRSRDIEPDILIAWDHPDRPAVRVTA